MIVGPNASGKSGLAVKIARKIDGEIISADSRQVYRELDIGTGKVEGKWKRLRVRNSGFRKIFAYKKIPHYCIDFVDPQKPYSVMQFKSCAKDAIKDIVSRGKMPILVGGTGFWIDTVVYDLNLPEVSPDKKLRRRLAKKNPRELLKILQKLDPRRAGSIEQKNPRRLIRAIEVARKLGKVPLLKKKVIYDVFWIGIRPGGEILRRKIKKRLLRRVETGMLEEAKKLRRGGLGFKRFYELGLEYKYLADYLRKKTTKDQFMDNLEKATNDYARRQMAWFGRNSKIRWIKHPREVDGIGLFNRFAVPAKRHKK